jgi:hypothetical protein
MLKPLVVLSLVFSLACGPELVLSSSTALTSGDEQESDEDTTAWLVITAIVAVTTIVGLVSALSGNDMLGYMQEHQQDVRRALASGDGPFPSDLTSGLGLPEIEVPRVARILRAGRPTLEPHLADGPITHEGAREFWRELLARLSADPVTGPEVERLRRRANDIIAGRTEI